MAARRINLIWDYGRYMRFGWDICYVGSKITAHMLGVSRYTLYRRSKDDPLLAGCWASGLALRKEVKGIHMAALMVLPDNLGDGVNLLEKVKAISNEKLHERYDFHVNAAANDIGYETFAEACQSGIRTHPIISYDDGPQYVADFSKYRE